MIDMKHQVEQARKLRSWDVRARMLVDAAVNEALTHHDDDQDRHFAFEVATDATSVLLRMIFEEDAEIARLRCEVAQLKAIAEEALRMQPPRLFIPTSDSDTRPKDGDAKQGSTRE